MKRRSKQDVARQDISHLAEDPLSPFTNEAGDDDADKEKSAQPTMCKIVVDSCFMMMCLRCDACSTDLNQRIVAGVL